MNILFETSIAASFISGMVALFAPCCITFMLPAYFAYTFKEKKSILLMTFIFFLGVATILIPIGLGVAYLASFFKGYHTQFFYLGGFFLLFLSLLSFSGKKLSLPFKQVPILKNHDAFSVYGLGLFSGLASSCCAPVLAGVLTLTALSASFYQALVLTLVYVFGMVFPLFLIAYFWDKGRLSDNKIIRGKVFTFNILGKEKRIHSTSLLSGTVFLLVGLLVLYLAASNQIISVSPQQAQLLALTVTVQAKILAVTSLFPDWAFLTILLVVIIFLLASSLNLKK